MSLRKAQLWNKETMDSTAHAGVYTNLSKEEHEKLHMACISFVNNNRLFKRLRMMRGFHIWKSNARVMMYTSIFFKGTKSEPAIRRESTQSLQHGHHVNPVLSLPSLKEDEDEDENENKYNTEHWKQLYLQSQAELNALNSEVMLNRRNRLKNYLGRWYRDTALMPVKWAMGKWKEVVVSMKNERNGFLSQLRSSVQQQQRLTEREELEWSLKKSKTMTHSFLCALYFYRWKFERERDIQTKERESWINEKRIIRKELMNLRQCVLHANRREIENFEACMIRGDEALHSLRGTYHALTATAMQVNEDE